MPIFFIATGPALALLARQIEWRAHRKQASLKALVEDRALPSSNTSPSPDRREFKPKPRFGGDSPQRS